MGLVRRVIWFLIGVVVIGIGIKTGFVDHYANPGSLRYGRYSPYTGTSATIFGCVFIALGLLTIYYVVTAKRQDAPKPYVHELRGWRLALYKTMKALWL